MGSVFKRGDSQKWWIGFTDATGKRCNISSGFTEREQAAKLLASIERRIRAEKESGFVKGPLTVNQYADRWLEARRERGIASVNEDEDRLKHARPHIGRMALKDVRHRHIRDMVRALMAAKPPAKRLAPRTIRHVYGVLRVMFEDAQVEELISGSPCTLKERRGELPRKLDKDPEWRDSAVFTRGEVEQLLSDERIPLYRRTMYGFIFLAGLRINEVTPRRWRDYDPTTEPLGRITIGTSYAVKRRQEKASTKTGRNRNIPVHPTLAKMLATWRLHGWAAHVGRQPKPDDLIFPRAYSMGRRKADPNNPQVIHSSTTLRSLHRDLETLGLRKRRQHDARRTFISLGIADGARKDILRWVSHGPTGDVMDLYTTLPWATLCAEVGHLKLQITEGKLVRLPVGGATP